MARGILKTVGTLGSAALGAGKVVADRLSQAAANPDNQKLAEKTMQRVAGVLGQSTGSIPFSRGPVVEMEKAAAKQVNKALFKAPKVEAGDIDSGNMYRDTSGDDESGRPRNMQPVKDDDFHSGFDDAMRDQSMKRRTGSNSGSSD